MKSFCKFDMKYFPKVTTGKCPICGRELSEFSIDESTSASSPVKKSSPERPPEPAKRALRLPPKTKDMMKASQKAEPKIPDEPERNSPPEDLEMAPQPDLMPDLYQPPPSLREAVPEEAAEEKASPEEGRPVRIVPGTVPVSGGPVRVSSGGSAVMRSSAFDSISRRDWLKMFEDISSVLVEHGRPFVSPKLVGERAMYYPLSLPVPTDAPGSTVRTVELKSGIGIYVYQGYEKTEFREFYRDAEYLAMGLFLQFGYRTWLKNNSVIGLAVASAHSSIEFSWAEASCILLNVIYGYCESMKETSGVSGSDFVYREIMDNLQKAVSGTSWLFGGNFRKSFVKEKNSSARAFLYFYFTLCLCELILQTDLPTESEQAKKVKKAHNVSRSSIAHNCRLDEVIRRAMKLSEGDKKTELWINESLKYSEAYRIIKNTK